MVLLMDAKIWMTSLIIMFAVRPTCVQDSLFKMSSESPALSLDPHWTYFWKHYIYYNKDTKVGSQNFGYQIWFCTRLLIGSWEIEIMNFFCMSHLYVFLYEPSLCFFCMSHLYVFFVWAISMLPYSIPRPQWFNNGSVSGPFLGP